MSGSDNQRTSPWSPSWGALGVILAIGSTAVGSVWGLATTAAQNAQTARELSGLRTDVRQGLDGVAQQIRDIPDLSARLQLLERQNRDGDVRDGQQQSQIDAVRQRLYEIGADMEGLKRASAVNLPGRPGARP
ncbi:MAG: hypothetical protein V4653_10495 [Pseudomonadota bacterium]